MARKKKEEQETIKVAPEDYDILDDNGDESPTSIESKLESNGSSSDNVPEVNDSNKAGSKGLIGHDFEDYLTESIGGNGSFKVNGREFDGGIDERWWEARSGNY